VIDNKEFQAGYDAGRKGGRVSCPYVWGTLSEAFWCAGYDEGNKLIYMTPFDPETMQYTGPSEDCGCATMEQVVSMFGQPQSFTQQTVIYPGLIFTRMVRK